MKKLTFLAAPLVLALASTAAAAQPSGYGMMGGYGYGVMGSYGPGMMYGYGPHSGYGYGPRHDVRLRGPLPALLPRSS